MKQSLDLRQGQKLTLTPHMQQGIRLLQMSTSELSEELQLAHEVNPLLEMREELGIEVEPTEDKSMEAERSDLESTTQGDPDNMAQLQFDKIPDPDQPTWDDPQNYAPIDQRRINRPGTQSYEESNSQYVIPEEPVTLREALGSQAIFLFSDEAHRRIAHHIIQNINDAGYLDVSLEEIEKTLGEREPVPMQDIEQVLAILQKLEPTGVAARNPKECLLLQLRAKNTDTPGFYTACKLVEHHLSGLANKEYSKLRKALDVSEEELGNAVRLIQNLNPHPGLNVGGAAINYIVPEILVEKKDKTWFAVLNPKAVPELVINDDYQKLISKGASSDFGSMKEQLQNAKWLLSNIEKRHKTILSVAREITERQQDFFNVGSEKMRPLTLADISQPLGIHESTVSRATSGKYLSAPQGIFELKYFFSSQIDNAKGESVSSTAIQSEIKRIIQNESPKKPVSDEKICLQLETLEYKVARRTVAKYRELLNIPSSSKRKSI